MRAHFLHKSLRLPKVENPTHPGGWFGLEGGIFSGDHFTPRASGLPDAESVLSDFNRLRRHLGTVAYP